MQHRSSNSNNTDPTLNHPPLKGERGGLRSLAKDTVIYGLSSIIGKFLNWLLVPLYTYVLAQQADYGIVTNLYAWTALLLVILTYGMETGFFRFANKEEELDVSEHTGE